MGSLTLAAITFAVVFVGGARRRVASGEGSPVGWGAGSWYANVPAGNMRDVAARDRS